MGVKQILWICALVMGQSVLAADKKPLIADPYFEKVIQSIRHNSVLPTEIPQDLGDLDARL